MPTETFITRGVTSPTYVFTSTSRYPGPGYYIVKVRNTASPGYPGGAAPANTLVWLGSGGSLMPIPQNDVEYTFAMKDYSELMYTDNGNSGAVLCITYYLAFSFEASL